MSSSASSTDPWAPHESDTDRLFKRECGELAPYLQSRAAKLRALAHMTDASESTSKKAAKLSDLCTEVAQRMATV